MDNEYKFSVNEGTVYDQFGCKWPGQDNTMKLSLSSYQGIDLQSDGSGLYTLIIHPSANHPGDFTLTITETKADYKVSKNYTVHTFEYNYTYLDENGNTLRTETVKAYYDANPPELGDGFCDWVCDEEKYWFRPGDGPQNRIVYRALLTGTGTKDDPCLIRNEQEWKYFKELTRLEHSGNVYFKLDNDIEVTSSVGESGARRNFSGHFDGDGHTITVNLKSDDPEERTAPFAYTCNATIENLKVDGNVYSSQKRASGLVGEVLYNGCIENCIVSATIVGKDIVSGFVMGVTDASMTSLKIKNCTFNGMIKGDSKCAGFVSYSTDQTEIRNCIADFKEGSVVNDGATFAADQFNKIIDCTYNNALGTPQGLRYDMHELTDDVLVDYHDGISTAKKMAVAKLETTADKTGKVIVSWKRNNNADGYQISYSKDKCFKKTVRSVRLNNNTSKTVLKKLKTRKSGKKIYIKIRTYNKIKNPVSGKYVSIYGEWSKVKVLRRCDEA